jgi:hypothetical protein
MFEINVGEAEFQPLLNRAAVISDPKRIFPGQLEVMLDITGTSLIPRAYGSSHKDL